MTAVRRSLREACNAGADAHHAGKPRYANPEDGGTLEWWAWDVGWRCAKENAEWARFRTQQSAMRAVGT